MVGLVIGFIVAAAFIIWGAVLCTGRGALLIAGYNTMSGDEKAKWDERRLCRSTGKMMIGSGIWVFCLVLLSFFDITWFVLATIPVFLLSVIAWVVYINKSPKFRR